MVLRAMFNGDKTYDIELSKYNEAEELLIETRTAGSQGTSKLLGTGSRRHL